MEMNENPYASRDGDQKNLLVTDGDKPSKEGTTESAGSVELDVIA